jgi:uncharacterized membrane protein YbaN (DUF454 family)
MATRPNHAAMPSLLRILKPLIPTVAFALLAGWSVHKDSPQGVLRDMGQGCLSVSHGFGSIYMTVLGVTGALVLAFAFAAFIASELRLFSTRRDALRSMAKSSLVFVVALAVASLLRFPIESSMPLQAPPANACPKT